MTALGIVVVAAGVGVVVRSAVLLAGRGRPQRGPRPAFVIAGVYRRVRNPLYGGLLLVLGGVALASKSPALGATTILAGLALHAVVVAVEEPRLRRRFGLAYEAYLRSVPRWIPGREPRSRDER